jgi:hypothetical protein
LPICPRIAAQSQRAEVSRSHEWQPLPDGTTRGLDIRPRRSFRPVVG